MASTSPKRRWPGLTPVLGTALAFWMAAAPAQVPISLDAESSELDLKNQRLVFTNARISQGDLRVDADTASSENLDFANAVWELEGSVRIESVDGIVEAAAATLRFENHRLIRALARGQPARFERKPPENEREIRGSATEIDLDATGRIVTLTGDASVTDGASAIAGRRLTYNLVEDRLLATSDGSPDERVRVVIVPPEEEDDDGTLPRDGGDP